MKVRALSGWILALACMLAFLEVRAQTNWLTLLGDPGNAAVDTIEVDPRPLSVNEQQRTLKLRVNRSALRANRDGVPYRSFESRVVFDCNNKTARYAQLSFYMLPLWQGPSHKTVAHSATEPRWVEFRSLEPNPLARIIRAACETGAVQRN